MNIRHFKKSDAAAVAALWHYWFVEKTLHPNERLQALVESVYLEDPNTNDEIRSLVAVDDAGRILGFLGVSAMPVLLDGKPAHMAGVFPSVVAPDAPSAVASLLLRKFLSGPQAFTFSDGGHVKFERIWQLLGGRIAELQSLRWIKLFQPAHLVTGRLAARVRSEGVRSVFDMLASGPDWLARKVAPSYLRPSVILEPGTPRSSATFTPKDSRALSSEPLTPEKLVDISAKLHPGTRLRPVYTVPHVEWQLEAMDRISSQGELTATLVVSPGGEPVGWYMYYLNRGGVSRVFAIEAVDRYLDGVIDHMFQDADERGAGALFGRMEPKLRRPMALRGTFVHNSGSLQMVHSKDPTLMDAALLGRLAFNRLQGENWYWWAIDAEADAHKTRV